ncbi:hypothetical protein Mmc1_0154 [Magnetococcus marinus MC-1]|uniref:Uncharacterized protein n=1 Tax=Magnetococcus marinus (strain ATCC BAA-1437 / JCM 17883 / MC-1) TaxID=156889 RepID=A0L3Y8_MAGMM|nr:hypothetical protein [Magnetococcus marinus]ABK42681.1 hypothetical protein Mmc1_0154 [Magnetococcus marinus MC-1]
MHQSFMADAIARRRIFAQLNDPTLIELQELANSGQLQDAELRRLDRIIAKLYDEAARLSGAQCQVDSHTPDNWFEDEDLFPPADAFEDDWS